tara:strand:+ start:1011 stop:1394 length:384 start_codon:yes stop_codon:yes gene_type:complete
MEDNEAFKAFELGFVGAVSTLKGAVQNNLAILQQRIDTLETQLSKTEDRVTKKCACIGTMRNSVKDLEAQLHQANDDILALLTLLDDREIASQGVNPVGKRRRIALEKREEEIRARVYSSPQKESVS